MKAKLTKLGKLSRGGKDLRLVISFVRGAAALLVALAVCSLPTPVDAILTPPSATGVGPAATDTSTLTPNTVNAGNDTPTYFTGQCPWITATMNAFVAANPATYTWTWAVPTFNLQADLSVSDYYAWVNTSPGSANGFAFANNVTGTDSGGCEFGLTYTPTAANSPSNVFFIQSYVLNNPNLLAGYPSAYTNIDNLGNPTPWYGGADSYTPAVSKMADQPYLSFNAAPPVPTLWAVQFQTAIAVDNVVGGTNNLTLYQGEEWWGYQFATAAIPEPTTGLLVVVSLVLLGSKGVRRRSAGSI